jgi:hypothetical protein
MIQIGMLYEPRFKAVMEATTPGLYLERVTVGWPCPRFIHVPVREKMWVNLDAVPLRPKFKRVTFVLTEIQDGVAMYREEGK